MSRSLAASPPGASTPSNLSGLNLGCGTRSPFALNVFRQTPRDKEGGDVTRLWYCPALMSGQERLVQANAWGPTAIKLILGNAESPSAYDEQQRLKNYLGRDPWLQGGSFFGLHDDVWSCFRPLTNVAGLFVCHFTHRFAHTQLISRCKKGRRDFRSIIFVTFVVSRFWHPRFVAQLGTIHVPKNTLTAHRIVEQNYFERSIK